MVTTTNAALLQYVFVYKHSSPVFFYLSFQRLTNNSTFALFAVILTLFTPSQHLSVFYSFFRSFSLSYKLALEGYCFTMFRGSTFRVVFFHSFLLLSAVVCLVRAQGACSNRPNLPDRPHIVTSVYVVKHTIHIMTSVPRDTTLQINTDLTLTVDNAPTSLDLMTTYDSESTVVKFTDA